LAIAGIGEYTQTGVIGLPSHGTAVKGRGILDSLSSSFAAHHAVLSAESGQSGALSDLTDTLALAGPRGYVRVFPDEGMPMRALLTDLQAAQPGQRHSARRIGPRYLAELVRACGGAEMARPRRPAATAAPGLVEPLTDREMEVLRLLATGKSNQRIAHDLVVALDTVKSTWTHVLGKLGAANRTEAVARARQLDLIP